MLQMIYEHCVSIQRKGLGNAQGQGWPRAGNPSQRLWGELYSPQLSFFCILIGSLTQEPMASRTLLSEQEWYSDSKHVSAEVRGT